MTSEAIDESAENVFMLALAMGSGAARRCLESTPTGANEPSGIRQLKPGRRTATVRFQDQPHALFLPGAISAMREPFAASHFRQVCARSITARVVAANVGGFWRKILQ